MPCYMYGPKGEARIFARAEDAPSGWKDAPPKSDGDVEGARRARDIPPGRTDRAALPTAIAGVADQVFAEVTARIGPEATPDERSFMNPYDPLAAIERIGERPTTDEPEAVVDQGDKQPHLEIHNFRVSDALRTAARVDSEKAKAEAQAAANMQARETVAEADAVSKELGDDPTVASLIAEGHLAPHDVLEAAEPADVAQAAKEAAERKAKPAKAKAKK